MIIIFFILVILSLLILILPNVLLFVHTRPSKGTPVPKGTQTRRAIVLCDLQEEYLDELSSPPYPYPEHRKILAASVSIIKASLQAGLPVVYLRRVTTNKFLSQILLDGRFLKDNPGSNLHRDLPTKGVKIIDWQHFDAFKVDEFTQFIEDYKISSLWLGGLDVENSIATTALAAANRNFSVSVLADCSAAIRADRTDEIYKKLEKKGIAVVEQASADPSYPLLTRPWRDAS